MDNDIDENEPGRRLYEVSIAMALMSWFSLVGMDDLRRNDGNEMMFVVYFGTWFFCCCFSCEFGLLSFRDDVSHFDMTFHVCTVHTCQ